VIELNKIAWEKKLKKAGFGKKESNVYANLFVSMDKQQKERLKEKKEKTKTKKECDKR